ncbi:hypothetical protein [Pseudomonas sp. NCCP-436]|uniref:hypothetical protein n=1 Tax=Pseudomonas sp. NCCP-436 TaxID=2842481 RepID=UPI001C809BAE|nr:hypothetical protein [Pseudomonas sp. NCCP-436]GIZ12203.1 hypothetical protein NCCP436_16190 [Pseudomonas sp. NCCP-436]
MSDPLAISAIQAMGEGRWQQAGALWQACLDGDEPLTAAEYNACARSCERLGQWALYRYVITCGLEHFPEDRPLQIRQQHARAVALMHSGSWQEAWELLESLRKEALSFDWPCGFFYWSRQARYEKTLALVEETSKRLQVLNELSLFKSSELLPQRIAGILLWADCQGWPVPLRAEFGRCVQPLIDCLRCYDQPVRFIEDPALPAAVADLAAFWQSNAKVLKALSAGDCEFFARLFLCFGYLDLYLQLRREFISALKRLLDSGNKSKVAFAYRLALANELGDSAEFVRLSEIAQEQEDTREYARISAIYHVGQPYERAVEDQDRDFAEYIRGKSIAIVGPVDVGLDSGAEIDGFDRVVRFNHRTGLSYEPRCFGSRTDVSYYVKALLGRPEPPPGLLAGMSELDYVVFIKNAAEGCVWLEQTTCRKREQQGIWNYLDNPLLTGYANAVPRALFDLLCFKPSRVKLFCSNLYTGMSYCREYLHLSSLARNGGNIFPNASLHDPVSNFVLMQRMVQRGLFEVDEVLQEILSWPVATYMDRLSAAHARFLARPARGPLLEA